MRRFHKSAWNFMQSQRDFRRCMSSQTQSIIIEKISPAIAHVILNRQDGKNSFSRKFLEEFNEAINDIREDDGVSVMILSSSVPKVFCAGADLKERVLMSEEEVETFVDSLRDSITLVEKLPFPTIAAIDGVALGGGLELALACDIRIVHANAIIGLPETALAIIPGAGGTQRLPRLIGISKAKEMMFLAKRLTGIEAAAIGLVNECIIDQPSSLDRAEKLAAEIAEKGPIALRMAKQAIDAGMQVDLEFGLKIEKACYSQVIGTSDRREGLAAFAEKRKPVYKGE